MYKGRQGGQIKAAINVPRVSPRCPISLKDTQFKKNAPKDYLDEQSVKNVSLETPPRLTPKIPPDLRNGVPKTLAVMWCLS